MYRASFVIFYNNQKMHNYSTNYLTPTCFYAIVPSSDSLQSIPCQVTQVFQMQLLVIQFIVRMLHVVFIHKALIASSPEDNTKVSKYVGV